VGRRPFRAQGAAAIRTAHAAHKHMHTCTCAHAHAYAHAHAVARALRMHGTPGTRCPMVCPRRARGCTQGVY
jgi:hypothetical protein